MPGPAARVVARGDVSDALYVLNFYSAIFVDQLKRGRKTATIRLGDKSRKYKRGQVVWSPSAFAISRGRRSSAGSTTSR